MSSEIGEEVRRSSLNIIDARNVFHGSAENYQKYLDWVKLLKENLDVYHDFNELPRQQMYLNSLKQLGKLKDLRSPTEDIPQYDTP
jgi:hypothetical protein